MGNRIIKESICSSEQIDELTPFEEVFFYRLLVNCDDYGVMDARPKMLKAKLFPLKDLGLQEITDAVNSLIREGLIETYVVEEKTFIKVLKWKNHQRIRNSKHKYPVPEGEEEETDDEEDDDDQPQSAASCGELRQNAARARVESESNPNPNTNPNTNPKPKKTAEDDPYKFSLFWNEYPRKVKKPEAMKAWCRIKPNEDMIQAILLGLKRWKTSEQWTRDDGRYVPYPATWLNGRQWEDDVPNIPRGRRTVTAQAYEQRDYSSEQEAAMERMLRMG